jgi:hypothetical protein
MSTAQMLTSVKNALGIQGEYQDETLTEYINEVIAFLTGAGIPAENISPGIVARGVSDLWSYGAGNGKLSEYFMQRAAQLSYKGASGNG